MYDFAFLTHFISDDSESLIAPVIVNKKLSRVCNKLTLIGSTNDILLCCDGVIIEIFMSISVLRKIIGIFM